MAFRFVGNRFVDANDPQFDMYNALGRNGGQEATGNSDNFFVKRGKSIENAVGTTLAAPISFANDRIHQMGTEQLLKDNQTKMQDIVKKYGYSSLDDYYDALDAAEAKEDKTEYNNLWNTVQKELQDQASSNYNAMKQRQTDYEDYRNNNYISQKINQDPGKFAGSAINTLSTMADVMLPAAGIAFNAAQGVAEGYADELEQNGFQNFDWNRANQNALIGGVTGGVTGAFNKGLSNSLAKNGGNLFKGGNRLTNWMNETGAKHPIMATLATGAGRGALSGAVGGATGGGLSAQLNGGNFLEGAARGAVQGAQSGAVTGATMAGANMALNATPGVGKVMRNLNQAGEEWKKSGSNFNERLTNTLNSGDSAIGNWLNKKSQSSLLSRAGMLGDTIRDYTDQGLGPRNAEREAFRDLIEAHNEDGGLDGALENAKAAGYPDDSNFRKALRAVEGGDYAISYDDAFNELKDVYGDSFNPDVYLNKDGSYKYKNGEPYVWTVYKNKLAMALGNELDARENGTTTFKNVTRAGEKTSADTPTTLGGWLKKAGERVVEDINDSNLGNRVKDVSADMPEDIRNMQTNDYNVNRVDAWDRLAQENGYQSYDDVIQRFMEANPNAEINPRGMAGAVTSWMDENPGNWNPNTAKTVGETLLDKINKSNLGMRIQDVSEIPEAEATPMSRRTPETEVYRTFNEDTENMVDIPQKPTGEQIKNKRLLVQEIQSQFNTVDTPTARGTKPNETFYNLYEDYGLSDGDDIRQAVAYAEPGSLLPQMISEAAGEAGIIDLSDAQALVMDLKLNKKQNYARTLGALEDLMDSTETTIIGGKAGVDALQFQRALEQAASDARGSNGTYHIGKNLVDETMAKNFDRIARNIGEKLDNAAVQKGAVQNVVNRHAADLQAMRNAFPNNTKWQENFVDKVANAQKISDLRHSIRDLTRANIYIRNGDEKFSTVGSTVARSGGRGISTDIPTTKGTLINRGVNYIADKIYNTDAARNARLEKYDQKIKGGDTVANTNNTSTSVFNALKGRIGGGTPTGTTTAQTQQMSNRSTLPTQIYNAIGRTEGATNAEQTRTANYLANAVQNANTLEDLAGAGYTDPSMSVYNSLYGEPTSTNGDYWTSVLSDAMEMARKAGDATAFGQLYSMYQDAVGSQAKTTTNKLTDKQRQANAAARALADFEQVTPNFGYDVSDIPVVGNIANWGGNEYLSKAEALALQIGYMLSGATVNKDEARKIGMSYIPQPRDSEAVRKSKLAQLRGIISDYQQTYAE
jgi:hypothetical protein